MKIIFFLIPILAGCAALITPNVFVMPGRGIPPDKFVADDNFCRDISSTSLRYGQHSIDAMYMQCMVSKGHLVPGSALPPPPPRSR